jgi:hypothetical protein
MMSLVALQRLLADLDELSGLERTREARRLAELADQIIAAAGDEGVYEATRSATYEDVAAELGVGINSVRKAIRRHAKAHKSAVRT